jgi:hypothetical protein
MWEENALTASTDILDTVAEMYEIAEVFLSWGETVIYTRRWKLFHRKLCTQCFCVEIEHADNGLPVMKDLQLTMLHQYINLQQHGLWFALEVW